MSRLIRLNIVIEVNEYPVVRFDPDNFEMEVDEKGTLVVTPGKNFPEFMERDVKFRADLSTCEEIIEEEKFE